MYMYIDTNRIRYMLFIYYSIIYAEALKVGFTYDTCHSVNCKYD